MPASRFLREAPFQRLGRDLVSTWRQLFRQRTCRHGHARRVPLRLEPLEERCLLAPVITVGDHVLLANLPDQQIQIRVAGGNAVQGVEFFLQVADGGRDAGGQINGPVIQDVDILGPPHRPQNASTIFTGNNTGEAVSEQRWPQFWQSGTTTAAGTISADGLLATVVLDTSGLTTGDANSPFDLKAQGTLMGDTNFVDENPVDIANGRLILKERPVGQIAGPTLVPGGGTAVFDGRASHAWDAHDTILAYEWDLDGDGVWGETGAGATRGDELGPTPTFSAVGLTGPSTWTVRLRVKDSNFPQNPAFVSEVATAEIGIARTHPWQNSSHPCDVSDDGFITPQDVLIAINSLNVEGARALAVPPPLPGPPPPYFDSSGDDWLTPLDVLSVINYLNAYGPGPVTPTAAAAIPVGEGEPTVSRMGTNLSRSALAESAGAAEPAQSFPTRCDPLPHRVWPGRPTPAGAAGPLSRAAANAAVELDGNPFGWEDTWEDTLSDIAIAVASA